jgi:O-antigen/teichoic acid export membrane protein
MEALELKRKTFHSVIWTVVRIGSTNVLTAAVFFILAQHLAPADLGVYALAFLCTDLAKTVATAGMAEMITQVPRLDEELADTAFWTALLISIVAAAGLWQFAGLYARATGEPSVAPVLRWFCIVVPVWALGALHMARKLRDFGHRANAGRSIICGLLGGASGIAAALYGLGVWSLVIQAIVNEVLGTLISWLAFPWLPRPRLVWSRLREIAGFSGSVTLSLLLAQAQGRVQDLIIGIGISAAALGTYRIAWRMLELISQLTVYPVMSVSLVTLAKLQHDRAAFTNAYGRMLGLMAVITLPAVTGFGVLAGDIILGLFGPRWADSVPIAEIMAFAAMPFSFGYFVIPTLISAGCSRASAEVSAVQLITTIAAMELAVPFGLRGVAVAFAARGYLVMPYQIWVLRRETGIPPAVIMKNLLPPLWASLFMAGGLLLLHPALQRHLAAPLLDALAGTLVGGLMYLLGLFLFGRPFLMSQVAVLRQLLAAGSKRLAIYGSDPAR